MDTVRVERNLDRAILMDFPGFHRVTATLFALPLSTVSPEFHETFCGQDENGALALHMCMLYVDSHTE
jgi:hypothetical protein